VGERSISSPCWVSVERWPRSGDGGTARAGIGCGLIRPGATEDRIRVIQREGNMRAATRVLIYPIALYALSGCVSQRTSGVDESIHFQGKTVALTARPRAAFVAATAGKAMFAVLGAVAMEESGKTIVAENGIEDPATTVSRALLAAAESHYGIVTAPMGPVPIDTTDISQLARAAKGADFLLDVQSYGQSFNAFPTDWSHYWVSSIINVRLIDVPKAKLIAEGHCAVDTLNDASHPTRAELLADKAARLKAILDAQSAQCASKFKREVLRIPD